MDGTIITANQNFLDAMGYRLDRNPGQAPSDVRGAGQRGSAAYQAFWANLNRGECQAAEYKRVGKGDREVWIQASYNPILDDASTAVKVIKFATDVSRSRRSAAWRMRGKISRRSTARKP